jgi:hypothetical protein
MSRISSVNIALPMITSGLRTRLERRVGTGTCSGSSAARGLRGVIRLSIFGLPNPSADRPDMEG